MIKSLILVGAGGAVGSMCRYLLSCLISEKTAGGVFPWGTFAVNVTGCFLVGLLYGLLDREGNSMMKILLVSGFCGGFTTFSSFVSEGLCLMDVRQYMCFAAYVAGSVLAGLAACRIGRFVTGA